MDRKDEIIADLAKLLEKGSRIMYDCYSEEDAVINLFLGQVAPEIRWAEKAKDKAYLAQEFLRKNGK